jgi:hypothetical protein
MAGTTLHYELSDKTRVMSYGGLGGIYKRVKQIGLDQALDNHLELLKVHLKRAILSGSWIASIMPGKRFGRTRRVDL